LAGGSRYSNGNADASNSDIGPAVIVVLTCFLGVDAIYMVHASIYPRYLTRIDDYRLYLFIGAFCTLLISILAIRDSYSLEVEDADDDTTNEVKRAEGTAATLP
jgi:hypothetical protein